MSASTLDAIHRVGDPVWIYDANHRVYAKNADEQRIYGRGPIWHHHWIKRTVTAETSRSWVVGEGWAEVKIPKKGATPWGVCWNEEEIAQRSYVHHNAHKIADLLRRSNDYDLLKKVADLLEFKP